MKSNSTPPSHLHGEHTFVDSLMHQSIAILTCHEKEKLLAPMFQQALSCRLVHTSEVDTDSLGSFTREFPRQGSQIEAARKKALLGAELTGCRFGMGSEGAFVGDPWAGMLPWNIEMVLLLDTKTGIEVTGFAEGAGMCLQRKVTDWESLKQFAAEARFPEHSLIIRPDDANQPHIAKGIHHMNKLKTFFNEAISKSANHQVFVENDLRAHCNPTRQAVIVRAAQNLLDRLHSSCPECHFPDFWLGQKVAGKPCKLCGNPTKIAKYAQWQCKYCAYTELRQIDDEKYANPAFCDYCNP